MTEAQQQIERPKLDPKLVAEVVRSATPLSAYDQAMKKARGFHEYYQGTVSNEPLRPLSH